MMLTKGPSKIDFLGIQVSISTFLLVAAGIALLIFFILLSILLLMFLRKKMQVKGYLSYNNKEYKLEDKIIQIESEILQIQKKFYTNRQFKKAKKIFKWK